MGGISGNIKYYNMIVEVKKMKSFKELLKLQKELDEAIEKPRKNGFIQKKTFENIFLDLNDEFREWLRELPKEFNFKNPKKKNYNREKELEELTDMLFFSCNL